jgi:hypothetical protein
MLLLIHIWRRSLNFGRKFNSILSILRDARKLDFIGETKIVFSWLLDGISNHPNAMSIVPGIIAVNAEWAARLVLFNSQEVKDAFRYTIGHEMTHQAGDYTYLEAFTADKRFVNWVSEVHADYGGAERAFDGDLNKAISAIEYKARGLKQDKDYQGHPSWKRRQEYLKVGSFDEKLIRQIAIDAGCKKQILIENVINYYKPIVLKQINYYG